MMGVVGTIIAKEMQFGPVALDYLFSSFHDRLRSPADVGRTYAFFTLGGISLGLLPIATKLGISDIHYGTTNALRRTLWRAYGLAESNRSRRQRSNPDGKTAFRRLWQSGFGSAKHAQVGPQLDRSFFIGNFAQKMH